MGVNHHVHSDLVESSKQYQRLAVMHDQLENEIAHASKQVCCDESAVKALKMKKLRVVDQMSMLERMAS